MKNCTKNVPRRRSHHGRPIQGAVWALMSLVWCYGAECHAQVEPGGFRDSTIGEAIREEDLPADPNLQHPPSGPADLSAERPFRGRWEPSRPLPTRGWDASSPPVPGSPGPPLPLEETPRPAGIRDTPEGYGETAGLSPSDLVALRFVEEGQGILEAGERERAQILFERAVELAPFQPYSYHFLGRISFSQGKLQQALAFLQKAELLLPRTNTEWLGETVCLRGQVAEDLGDIEEARSAYKRCLRFAPGKLQALTALARLPQEEPGPVFPPGLPPTNVFQTQTDGAGNRDVLR